MFPSLTAAAALVPPCLPEWTHAPDTGFCYFSPSGTRYNYDDALAFCRKQDEKATLMMPKSWNQWAGIIKMMGGTPGGQREEFQSNMWVGMDDRQEENVFEWNDGEVWEPYTMWSNWAIAQPDDGKAAGDSSQDCVVWEPAMGDGMADWPCDTQLEFVCQVREMV